jgi:hypothetical protein
MPEAIKKMQCPEAEVAPEGSCGCVLSFWDLSATT